MSMVSMNISGMTVVWVVIGTLIGIVAGAVSGMLIGGKALGDYKLAAMMGSMYSAMPVLPGIVLGAIVLALW
ncbi:hypothetical protein NRY68_17125 [Acidithiobacillus ferrooxidans]|uniref:hypothetical protein n=1 Tax=Acidithiobacillus ferrooxidans TaxID=920 RepID=UPI0021487E5C|nr:hypothetical protein [Acidithiobacillus ferrooxidans]MCR1347475.1 hypothetical protein [Acidithiobacillus ferrooxidans]MCR1355372.1 hypothetical protein [Acidithiobacillus ferrooxidans]